RAGGSRGVDQRRDIVWPNRLPRQIEIEIGFASQSFEVFEGQAAVEVDVGVDNDHAGEVDPGLPDSGQKVHFGEYDLVLGISEQVPDLVRRRGVVDREWGRAEMHDGGVRQMELRTVAQHQTDRV